MDEHTSIPDLGGDNLGAFLDYLYGEDSGYMTIAYADRDRNWQKPEIKLRWPDDRDKAMGEIVRLATDYDVYVCVSLTTNRQRRKGTSVSRNRIHADIDGDLDAEKVKRLGGCAVASGTPGHAHVYVALSESVDLDTYRALCKALGSYLGNADAKHTDNDVLRPPNTLNHKHDPPLPVRWLVSDDGTRWHPDDLAAMLGVEDDLSDNSERIKKHSDFHPQANRAWINTAVAGALSELAACPPGGRPVGCMADPSIKGRNGCLNYYAGRLGRMLPNDREWLRGKLIEACQANGVLDDDGEAACHATIDSAFLYADAKGPNNGPQPDIDENWTPAGSGDADALPSGTTKLSDEDITEANVQLVLDRLRVRREAQRRLDAEERPVITYPAVKSLKALLAEPDTPTRYRIEKLAPEGARVMLSAQYKAGKTISVGNLLRALVDGDNFLGAFTVEMLASHVVLIDAEMSENMLRLWLRDQGIEHTSAVADVIALRGKVSAFNLLDLQCRAEWAARLRDLDCDYLILDCLRPVLDVLGLDENRDAGTFLVAFDELMAEAGIGDALIVHHMGHANERSRGDSRLQDWPDAIWRIVRETEEPTSPRFFSAYGRDVDVYEGRLSFDPVTRRLTYAGGSRTDAKTEAAKLAVVELLAAEREPMTKTEIETALGTEHSQKAIRAGIAAAVKSETVAVETGAHNRKLHRIAYPCEVCGKPVTSHRERHESCR